MCIKVGTFCEPFKSLLKNLDWSEFDEDTGVEALQDIYKVHTKCARK